MTYILKWNSSVEDNICGEERFETKSELHDRIDELNEEYEDELEYEYYPAERCKCCGAWVRKSEKNCEEKSDEKNEQEMESYEQKERKEQEMN